jgi:hypothetical protein
MTQSVTYTTRTAPLPAKIRPKSATGTFEVSPNPRTATAEIAGAAGRPCAASGSIRPCWPQQRGNENGLPAGVPSDPLRTETAGTERDISQKNESSRLGRVSLAVGDLHAVDVEASVKARMLRELAAWYRTSAARAGNPVIWESRLLTAMDLDAEASRLEQKPRA